MGYRHYDLFNVFFSLWEENWKLMLMYGLFITSKTQQKYFDQGYRRRWIEHGSFLVRDQGSNHSTMQYDEYLVICFMFYSWVSWRACVTKMSMLCLMGNLTRGKTLFIGAVLVGQSNSPCAIWRCLFCAIWLKMCNIIAHGVKNCIHYFCQFHDPIY